MPTLADEDKPKLVPVGLRYINDVAITESAVGFVETADMSAEGIFTEDSQSA